MALPLLTALDRKLDLTRSERLLLVHMGLVVALLTLRARRAWVLFALVPLFANGSLLFMPWFASELVRR